MNTVALALRNTDEAGYPTTNHPHEMNEMVVLTVGRIGDYAAYTGPLIWGWDRISREGNKISRERAEQLFGDFIIKESTYRR